MIGNAPRSYITGVPGWETPAEQELLVRLSADVPQGGLIVEIGAEYGMSASLFAYSAHSSVEIISLDLFPGELLNQHRANLTAAGLAQRTRPVQIDSHHSNVSDVWFRAFQREPVSLPEIDLLFIDGDHSYAGCKADITIWTPHVRAGGRVAFHDTACESNLLPHAQHYEVSQAIYDWLAMESAHWRLIAMVDSIMVFERLS